MLRRVLFCAVLLAGCENPLAPYVPEKIEHKYGAFRFTPPAHYLDWWKEVEGCSGKTGDFDAVQWYQATFTDILPGTTAAAISDYARQVVVVAEYRKEEANVIRHEALHLIIKVPGHPPEFFQGPCGNLVE